MELKLSPTGIPFIELDENNKIIFSESTSDDIGYKWVVFSGMSTTTMSVSSGKGKKKTKSRKEILEPISFIMDMSFSKIPKGARASNIYLTKRYIDSLKRMFSSYLVNGRMPFDNVPKLAKDINNDTDISSEDLLEDDPNGYYEEDDNEGEAK